MLLEFSRLTFVMILWYFVLFPSVTTEYHRVTRSTYQVHTDTCININETSIQVSLNLVFRSWLSKYLWQFHGIFSGSASD